MEPKNKIFIPRDYSYGTAVRFQTRYPPELTGKIEEQVWLTTIDEINKIYDDAEALDCSTYCESCLSCLTGYLINICMESKYEKCVKKAARYVEQQNDTVYVPRGVLLVDPMDRGLRCIEIVFLETRDR